ncbi:glycosyltransferase, partial [Arachidicoccus sp.]|uniref:glycosyltransferase n=1 Tax=Arachidicoccus sp. TaxID=1872624 RepID=UPI003D201A6E
KEVARLYNEHETHVLASWFETTGLSTLEAAVCGCNIVITDKGDTKEYFQDVGYYCDPADTRSIREAIEQAMNSAKNKDFPKKIIRENNWEQTAKKTYDAYVNVMNKYKKTNKSFI